jgi:pyrroline-5-carboxylate reductase
MTKARVGFIGAGNMAEAIARGVMSAGVFAADQMLAADVSPERREFFQSQLGIVARADAQDIAGDCDLILLAVKPQHLSELLTRIGSSVRPEALVVSIVAGATIGSMESKLPGRAVVRTMPNTPLMVGRGATALAGGTHATPSHLQRARQLFEPRGVVVDVAETDLDAVTALSGSGPAYFFLLVEAMTRAGVTMGLSEAVARTLARQTAVGAGELLLQSPESAENLRRKVTSPGGTTQAAVEHFQSEGFEPLVIDALHAARRRGQELGKLSAG